MRSREPLTPQHRRRATPLWQLAVAEVVRLRRVPKKARILTNPAAKIVNGVPCRGGIWSRATAVAAVGCILAMVCSAGCGNSDAIGDVSGTISVDGSPAGPGTIMFDPVPGEGPIGPSAVGQIGSDGRYTLTLPGGKNGAHVGEYRVMILSAVKEEFGEEEAATTRRPSRINIRYEDIKHSGLTATVVPGDNVIDFELEP